ncbi:FAD/NAD(P)-binding oxidoreductase [Mesorhizobium sp. B2-6-2]|uniref:FAD/NAD(P)-dependent oxidoreductase n=1 Tax=Mesorhizobium sp. B2-6-2 TaxID=2589915 RepID=UPI001125C17C|nr:FAD/NAD(P)-binding oxidoreductase [Mesorhizobium sp. B2-6-2]TPJ77164.1 NAD(P)/FAD-dependent oxidoreductase [Mesorhizobium sp. B2-6-2]
MTASIVIVGAGPAGVRAAEVLAQAGLRPIVLDEAKRPGGQIYRQPPAGAERDAAKLYGSEAGKARAIHAALAQFGDRIDYRPNTLVWNCFDQKLNTLSNGAQGIAPYNRLILATGAFDRIIPFPGWTLPGVYTLGGAQIALKAQGVAVGKRVALVGGGPLLPLVASQYLEAGGEVAAVIDVTPFSAKVKALPAMMALPSYVKRGMAYLRTIRRHGVKPIYGAKALEVIGDTHVEGLKWRDGSGRWHQVACDAVAASFGLKPEMQLVELAGCDLRFDEPTRQWLPSVRDGGRSSNSNVYLAGDCAAIGGADVAELTGQRAAYSVLQDLGIASPAAERLSAIQAELDCHARFRSAIDAAYPFPVHLVGQMQDSLMVCRCEGVTVGELRANIVKTAAPEVNRLKAFTRVGMGRCQGRVCGAMAAEILAEKSGRPLAEVGRLRGQHPVKPIPMVV